MIRQRTNGHNSWLRFESIYHGRKRYMDLRRGHNLEMNTLNVYQQLIINLVLLLVAALTKRTLSLDTSSAKSTQNHSITCSEQAIIILPIIGP